MPYCGSFKKPSVLCTASKLCSLQHLFTITTWKESLSSLLYVACVVRSAPCDCPCLLRGTFLIFEAGQKHPPSLHFLAHRILVRPLAFHRPASIPAVLYLLVASSKSTKTCINVTVACIAFACSSIAYSSLSLARCVLFLVAIQRPPTYRFTNQALGVYSFLSLLVHHRLDI